MAPSNFRDLSQSFYDELQSILHWWIDHMIDHDNGGFYGRMDGSGNVDLHADKGAILNMRILWAFAAAARVTNDRRYTSMAKRAFGYVSDHFWDRDYGGVIWSVDCQGAAKKTRKQVYAQAFAIYAFSEYYMLTGEEWARQMALQIFTLLQKHSHDQRHDGYFEAFDRKWQHMDDVRLSTKDLNAAKTMNTHLHILEAYTNLYRMHNVSEVHKALVQLVRCYIDRFVGEDGHLRLFFEAEWDLLSSHISFGHEIESSWLIIEATDALADAALSQEARVISLKLAMAAKDGCDPVDGALFNERDSGGILDTDKDWWPQAEAVVGFWNSWQLSGEEKYQLAAQRIWETIRTRFRDAVHGEWHWRITTDGRPDLSEDKAGPWKAPYHNARMCMEMIRRLSV